MLDSLIEDDVLQAEDLSMVWFTRHDGTSGLKDLGLWRTDKRGIYMSRAEKCGKGLIDTRITCRPREARHGSEHLIGT